MDMKNEDNKIITPNSSEEEGEKMPAAVKEKQENKGLSLSVRKLRGITVKPKVEDGKLLFNKNKKDHRYIVDEEF